MAADRPIIHVDKPLTRAEAAVVGDRATIVGPGDDTLAGVTASVIGVGHQWDAARFARFPELRCLSRMGIGYDNIDVAAASAAGVMVCNAPDSPTVSTAEHAVALMMSITKELPIQQARAEAGERGPAVATSLELDGATLGLVALGRIACRVARAAQGLGMRVIASDPGLSESPVEGVELVDLERVLETSDVVSLHAPAVPATRHLVNARTLARMKPGAYLINTARGALVDQDALADALDAGHLAGAGLDVTEPEPLPVGHRLLGRPNVIVTPHISSSTAVGRVRLFEHAFENALRALTGGAPTVVPEQT